jgi:hypothetical protein
VPNVVSVPAGDLDTAWIDICYDELMAADRIILWPDNDESCQKMIPRIAERLGKTKVRVVKSQYKDANEMLIKETALNGAEDAERALYVAVSDAEWFYDGSLVQLADVQETDLVWDGCTTGIAPLDQVLGRMFLGTLTLHAGSTKHGKSSALNQIMCQAAEQGSVVMTWPGEDEISKYRHNISIHLAGRDGIEARLSQRTNTEYAAIREPYKERITDFMRDRFIVLNQRSLTEEALLENMHLAFARHGCTTFGLDNLMKLVASKDAENVYVRQSRIVNMLSDFAKETKTAVHLAVHTGKQGLESEPPHRNAISGSKEIINLCDRCLIYWKIPEEVRHVYGNNESLIVVAADRVFGDEVQIPLRYHKLTKRYSASLEEHNFHYTL